jgi:hypothetical protein
MNQELARLLRAALDRATEGLRWNGERWVENNALTPGSDDEENIDRGTE